MPVSFAGGDGAEQAAAMSPATNGVAPFAELCAQIYSRVEKFLTDDLPAEGLKGTQEQTRNSLDVISEALERYKWVRYICVPLMGR